MRTKLITALAIITACFGFDATPASAGCGCEKPPPVPAAVRPHATFVGSTVTLFHPALVEGRAYDVSFISSADGTSASVEAEASTGHDTADGVEKPRIIVHLPNLPLGPTAVEIAATDDGSTISSLSDDHLTVVPQPITLDDTYGERHLVDTTAAVGRDGLTYLALDLSGLQRPTIFLAQALGLPLRFSNEDVVFYNTQGVLMQALVDESIEPIPGMFVTAAENPAGDSDILHYSRHEFASYFLQHAERAPHAVDENDPDWHLDGSRHIDHNILVLAIDAVFDDGSSPAPGHSDPFDLRIETRSLFGKGVVGHAAMTIRDRATTDSFDPGLSLQALSGDLYSNGVVEVLGHAVVNGNVYGARVIKRNRAEILGKVYHVTEPVSFMEVQTPQGLPHLGEVVVHANESRTITGPGSYAVDELTLRAGSSLIIDNAKGPVTLYLSGPLDMWFDAEITTTSPDPEQFAIYATGAEPLTIWAAKGCFNGVIYAPHSELQIRAGDFYGAFVAAEATVRGTARIHYSESLRAPISFAPVLNPTTGNNSVRTIYTAP